MHVHFRFNNSIHTHRSSDFILLLFILPYSFILYFTWIFIVYKSFMYISLTLSAYSRINYFIIITCNWFTTKWQLWQSWQDILYIVKSKKLFKISFTSTLHSYTQYETALMSFSDWSTYKNENEFKNVAWC